ncbi:hypothetical protein ACWGDE_03665 [Streptomyces sp. NPDC054956]
MDSTDPPGFPGIPELAHPTKVMTGLAENPALPDEIAIPLLPHGLSAIALVQRRGTPSALLCEAILAHGKAFELACGRSLPPEFAARLAVDPDFRVRLMRVQTEDATAGRHDLFAADPAGLVRHALAMQPGLSPRTQATLAADPSPQVREALAGSRTEPAPHLLRALLTDADPRVRTAACRHRPPDDLLAALLADPATRWRALRFAGLDEETAAALAADPDYSVRLNLAEHPQLPARVRDLLARDPDPHVRGKIFARADTPPELRDEIHAWLVAGNLRSREELPDEQESDAHCGRVLFFLERQDFPWVEADPVPHARSPHVGLRRAAARSGRLPEGLVREMLHDEDPRVRMTALSRTPGADLATAEDIERRHEDEKSLERPADYYTFPPEVLRRFATDPDAHMRALAVRDPELPAALRERLAADEDPSVRQAVAADPRAAPETVVRLLGDGSERVARWAARSPRLPVEAMRAVLDLVTRDPAAGRGPA